MPTSAPDMDDHGEQVVNTLSRPKQMIKLPNHFVQLAHNDKFDTHNCNVSVFLMEITKGNDKDEPTIHEAMKSSHWPEWLTAIHAELEALKTMGVYTHMDHLPPGKKAVRSHWVLIIKHNQNREIEKFKACLKAQGFTQIPGQDFNHTFAPIAHWDSIHFVLCIVAVQDLELQHIDIKTAYLHRILKEEIYLQEPSIIGNGYWLLHKALYSLKQAGHEWYAKLHNTFCSMGMMQHESDWSVHHRTAGGERTIMTTSVDNILAASSSKSESDKFTQQLRQLYALMDNNDIKWILGCQVTCWCSFCCLKLDREWYTTTILKQFNMEHCNVAAVLMLSQLNSNDCAKTENKIMAMCHVPYCELVSKLMYLATCTCPDIAFMVWEFAKFMSNYGSTHWKAAKHLLCYLQGT